MQASLHRLQQRAWGSMLQAVAPVGESYSSMHASLVTVALLVILLSPRVSPRSMLPLMAAYIGVRKGLMHVRRNRTAAPVLG